MRIREAGTDAGAFRAWKGRAAALAPLLIGHVETIAYGLGMTSRAQHKACGFIRDICAPAPAPARVVPAHPPPPPPPPNTLSNPTREYAIHLVECLDF